MLCSGQHPPTAVLINHDASGGGRDFWESSSMIQGVNR